MLTLFALALRLVSLGMEAQIEGKGAEELGTVDRWTDGTGVAVRPGQVKQELCKCLKTDVRTHVQKSGLVIDREPWFVIYYMIYL